jgi:hypothetical protein
MQEWIECDVIMQRMRMIVRNQGVKLLQNCGEFCECDVIKSGLCRIRAETA